MHARGNLIDPKCSEPLRAKLKLFLTLTGLLMEGVIVTDLAQDQLGEGDLY